jgi:hypothetical protein
MAEVGLTPSVRIALQVSKAVLPRERSRFSKHQFTQPHLLVVLRQMHYEDLTFREAELSVGEHRECQNVRRWGCPGYPTSRPRTVSCSPAASRRPSIGPSVRDGARLRGKRETPIGLVLADAEFDGERNCTYTRQQLGAQSVIPAKLGKKTWRVRGVRAEVRRAFLRRLYHAALW